MEQTRRHTPLPPGRPPRRAKSPAAQAARMGWHTPPPPSPAARGGQRYSGYLAPRCNVCGWVAVRCASLRCTEVGEARAAPHSARSSSGPSLLEGGGETGGVPCKTGAAGLQARRQARPAGGQAGRAWRREVPPDGRWVRAHVAASRGTLSAPLREGGVGQRSKRSRPLARSAGKNGRRGGWPRPRRCTSLLRAGQN